MLASRAQQPLSADVSAAPDPNHVVLAAAGAVTAPPTDDAIVAYLHAYDTSTQSLTASQQANVHVANNMQEANMQELPHGVFDESEQLVPVYAALTTAEDIPKVGSVLMPAVAIHSDGTSTQPLMAEQHQAKSAELQLRLAAVINSTDIGNVDEKKRKKTYTMTTAGPRADARPAACNACGCTVIKGADSGGNHRKPGLNGKPVTYAKWECREEDGGCGIVFKMLRVTAAKGKPLPAENFDPLYHDPTQQVEVSKKQCKDAFKLPRRPRPSKRSRNTLLPHASNDSCESPTPPHSPHMFDSRRVSPNPNNPRPDYRSPTSEEAACDFIGWFNMAPDEPLVSPSNEEVAGRLMKIQGAGQRAQMLESAHGIP